MFTLKIIVAGLALAAPHKHVTTTFRIPFEAEMACHDQLRHVRDETDLFYALAAKRQPVKNAVIEASCVATGTTRA